MLADAAVITPVLEKEKCQSGSDHLVLIPFGMLQEEAAHAVKQHLRHLRLQADQGPMKGGTGGFNDAAGPKRFETEVTSWLQGLYGRWPVVKKRVDRGLSRGK